jgi:hypothetical protein
MKINNNAGVEPAFSLLGRTMILSINGPVILMERSDREFRRTAKRIHVFVLTHPYIQYPKNYFPHPCNFFSN